MTARMTARPTWTKLNRNGHLITPGPAGSLAARSLLPRLHFRVGQPKVVPDLVNHRQPDLFDHLCVGTADRLDVVLIDDDDLGQLIRRERGSLEFVGPVIQAEDVSA